jgi:hypothetical protein
MKTHFDEIKGELQTFYKTAPLYKNLVMKFLHHTLLKRKQVIKTRNYLIEIRML